VLIDVVFDIEYVFGEGFDVLNDEGEECFIGVSGTFDNDQFNSKQNYQQHSASECNGLCVCFFLLVTLVGLSIYRLLIHQDGDILYI
jgi:hypothetical protein